MPLDATGYVPSPRVLTPIEERELAVLRAARHRIRHRWRWLQFGPLIRAWQLLSGGMCSMEAVKRAAGGVNATGFSVWLRMRAKLPPGWSSVEAYNDAPTTTHADILALFDRAIAEIEE
jgi:hypothetical protein